MNKREFIKTSMVVGAATFIAPAALSSCMSGSAKEKSLSALSVLTGSDGFVQPELAYAYNALEPHIDAETMEVHYSKHHAGYTSKFNAALKNAGESSTDILDIFSRVSTLPAGVRNNGGGYFNHNLYWKFLSPNGGGEPVGKSGEAITKAFGSFDSFKEQFSAAAATLFGSGWAWLIRNEAGELQIVTTANQDNPLMDVAAAKGTPLLNIDVWEHAYYLKNQNRRGDYIASFWNVVNWGFVEELFETK